MSDTTVYNPNDLFTSQQYADLRQCSLRTIERERTRGTWCPFAVLGRRVYYRRRDIETYIAARVFRSTSEAKASLAPA